MSDKRNYSRLFDLPVEFDYLCEGDLFSLANKGYPHTECECLFRFISSDHSSRYVRAAVLKECDFCRIFYQHNSPKREISILGVAHRNGKFRFKALLRSDDE